MNEKYNELIDHISDSLEILNVLTKGAKQRDYDLFKMQEYYEKFGHVEKAYIESIPRSQQNYHHIKRMTEILYSQYDERFGVWGWCSLNKAGCIIDCLEDIFKTKRSPVCVEVGVYGGKSVLPALLQLKRFHSGIFHAIDPWTNEEAVKGYEELNYEFWKNINLDHVYDIFNFVVDNSQCREYVKIHRAASDEAPLIENIDYLYIDGQHTEQALRDAEKYASQVNVDGYCIADDIVDGWSSDAAITKVPDLLNEMGFEFYKKVDVAMIFKRKSR